MTWKAWSGHGKQPAGQVDIRLRSGREIKDTAARKWLWGRADNDNKNGGEIVAYRELMEAA
ncbi:hypothetical protein [Shinella sp. BYT-45]|uniref:hypothetical protein n=1 Tax=Shinella sp. BYT-45 TaxID=3377377 RepID=UPI003980A173